MSKYLFVLAFLTWFAAGMTWTVRLFGYFVILQMPIPRWGFVIMLLSWTACIMTILRLFAPYDELTNTIISSLWLLVASIVLATTLIKNPKGDGDGKRNQDKKN